MMRTKILLADQGGLFPQIPGYEILRLVGQGGMGEVFAARQLALGRLVALKCIAIENDTDPDRGMERFRREAELMARVSHPNILSVFDFGVVDGRAFIVMEYVEGGDLRRRMTPDRPMRVGEVREILGPVCEALTSLHRQGILHRDLKPENILMHDEHNPKVADFGIAVLRAGIGSLTRTGVGLGTLGYIAPEQQFRLTVDERADQYSLAAVAYEMLTGVKALGVFRPPSSHNPSLGPAVDAVIKRGLAEDPSTRYPSIRDFGSALDEALARVQKHKRWPYALPLLAVSVLVTALCLMGFNPSRSVDRPVAPPGGVSQSQPYPGVPNRPALDALREKLIELQAYLFWIEQKRPTGEEGKAVEKPNWDRAVTSINKEVDELAFKIWESRGRPSGEIEERYNRFTALMLLEKILHERIAAAEKDKN